MSSLTTCIVKWSKILHNISDVNCSQHHWFLRKQWDISSIKNLLQIMKSLEKRDTPTLFFFYGIFLVGYLINVLLSDSVYLWKLKKCTFLVWNFMQMYSKLGILYANCCWHFMPIYVMIPDVISILLSKLSPDANLTSIFFLLYYHWVSILNRTH